MGNMMRNYHILNFLPNSQGKMEGNDKIVDVSIFFDEHAL